MHRVLIIEDEPVLRSSMSRGLSKLPDVVVIDVGTIKGALEVIDQSPPQMIISDIDLPDRSGIELLGELGRRGLKLPILFVSAYLKAYGSQIPPHANVDVREKPVHFEELRAIVQERLGATAKEAEIAPFGVADYVQLACLGRHSVIIEVESPEARGRIVIDTGTVWTAADERGEGTEAFQRLAFVQGGATRVATLRGEPGPRTIDAGWEGLLINAARHYDEEVHASARGEALTREGRSVDDIDLDVTWPSAPVPAELSVSPPRAPEAAERPSDIPSTARSAGADAKSAPPDALGGGAAIEFEDIWDAGVAALLKKDYHEAWRAFSRAAELRPEDPKVSANLSRLRQLGYGEPAEENQP